MAHIAQITIFTISCYRRSMGTPYERYVQASDMASNLYMYGDEKNNIMAWDASAYEQAMERLEISYQNDLKRQR